MAFHCIASSLVLACILASTQVVNAARFRRDDIATNKSRTKQTCETEGNPAACYETWKSMTAEAFCEVDPLKRKTHVEGTVDHRKSCSVNTDCDQNIKNQKGYPVQYGAACSDGKCRFCPGETHCHTKGKKGNTYEDSEADPDEDIIDLGIRFARKIHSTGSRLLEGHPCIASSTCEKTKSGGAWECQSNNRGQSNAGDEAKGGGHANQGNAGDSNHSASGKSNREQDNSGTQAKGGGDRNNRRKNDVFCTKCENAFRIIGTISADMPEKEFKNMYRKGAVNLHPDKLLNDPDKKQHEEAFKIINGCYNGVGNLAKNYLDCCKLSSPWVCKVP